jgi:DNA-binding CsgD family transcriptional regulator
VPLTPREKEILQLYVELASANAVAEVLALSPQTVKNHLYEMRKKVGAKNTSQLVYMLATGVLDDPI